MLQRQHAVPHLSHRHAWRDSGAACGGGGSEQGPKRCRALQQRVCCAAGSASEVSAPAESSQRSGRGRPRAACATGWHTAPTRPAHALRPPPLPSPSGLRCLPAQCLRRVCGRLCDGRLRRRRWRRSCLPPLWPRNTAARSGLQRRAPTQRSLGRRLPARAQSFGGPPQRAARSWMPPAAAEPRRKGAPPSRPAPAQKPAQKAPTAALPAAGVSCLPRAQNVDAGTPRTAQRTLQDAALSRPNTQHVVCIRKSSCCENSGHRARRTATHLPARSAVNSSRLRCTKPQARAVPGLKCHRRSPLTDSHKRVRSCTLPDGHTRLDSHAQLNILNAAGQYRHTRPDATNHTKR